MEKKPAIGQLCEECVVELESESEQTPGVRSENKEAWKKKRALFWEPENTFQPGK